MVAEFVTIPGIFSLNLDTSDFSYRCSAIPVPDGNLSKLDDWSAVTGRYFGQFRVA